MICRCRTNGFEHKLGTENKLWIGIKMIKLHTLKDLPSESCANLTNSKKLQIDELPFQLKQLGGHQFVQIQHEW